MKKKLDILIGTRPNFIKVTRFKQLGDQYGFEVRIIHTGQHYDRNMADVFFEQFRLTPDHFLEIPQGSPVTQMAEIMLRMEKLYKDVGKPDVLMVPGDVNSTLAGALVANKLNIVLAHLEAGLRSKDRGMPEEHNRVLTDGIADIFLVTEQSGKNHLLSEGVPESKIHFVGNTMIDTLVAFSGEIDRSAILKDLDLNYGFVLMTIHRPSNVDTKEGLNTVLEIIDGISKRRSVVLPVHPRTRRRFEEFDIWERLIEIPDLIITEPLGYFDFQALVRNSSVVITDSGGIQEESTFLGIPCLTLRENTERPVTIDIGTNTLVPFDAEVVIGFLDLIENGTYKKGSVPELWDGHASERVLTVLSNFTR